MISLNNICKKYDSKIVLDNVSYTFEKDSCYLLKGSSGIGKTTILNIIGGYIESDSGTVTFSESPKMEYMFQEELLFSKLTVLENIAIKYYASHTDLEWDLSEITRLSADIVSRFELETFLDRPVSSLSGGERQRVVLATMVMSDANILLMDEPVTNLDEENRTIISNLINELVPGRTIIIVSHIDLPQLNNVVKLTLQGGALVEE